MIRKLLKLTDDTIITPIFLTVSNYSQKIIEMVDNQAMKLPINHNNYDSLGNITKLSILLKNGNSAKPKVIISSLLSEIIVDVYNTQNGKSFKMDLELFYKKHIIKHMNFINVSRNKRTIQKSEIRDIEIDIEPKQKQESMRYVWEYNTHDINQAGIDGMIGTFETDDMPMPINEKGFVVGYACRIIHNKASRKIITKLSARKEIIRKYERIGEKSPSPLFINHINKPRILGHNRDRGELM